MTGKPARPRHFRIWSRGGWAIRRGLWHTSQYIWYNREVLWASYMLEASDPTCVFAVKDVLVIKTCSAFLRIRFWISLMRKDPELPVRTVIRTLTTDAHNCSLRCKSGFPHYYETKTNTDRHKLDSEGHVQVRLSLSILFFLSSCPWHDLLSPIYWLNGKGVLWICIYKTIFTLAKWSFCCFTIGWPLSWFARDYPGFSTEYSSS